MRRFHGRRGVHHEILCAVIQEESTERQALTAATLHNAPLHTIPIGVLRLDVPQVGGQPGEFPFDIEPGAIPVDQSTCGKSMTHVLQPGTVVTALGWRSEADSLRQFGESVFRHRTGNPAPAFGKKERGGGWCRKDAVSIFGVLFQNLYGGRMNRNITRFSKLRPPDLKDSEFEVDIRSVQTQSFVHPHSCYQQEAEKGRIGARAEPLGGGELLRMAKKLFNVFVAINVRRLAPVRIREKSYRGNLGARIDGAMPNGEAPDDP